MTEDRVMARLKATPEKKTTFLAELLLRGSVYHAAKATGINRRTAYRWREHDEEFAAAWDDAVENVTDTLEASLYERAIGGDTTASIFLLKGRRPEKYRERHETKHTGMSDLAQVLAEIGARTTLLP